MKVRLSITGATPLIAHNIQMADPLNKFARQLKAVTKKRTKTDEDHLAMARIEFEGSLYYDDTLGPYIPGQNIEKCVVEGARISKQGKQIERGLFVLDDACPLVYAGPRDIPGLWGGGDSEFVSGMMVRVGTQRVRRTRPIFRTWALEVEAELDPALLNPEELQGIVDSAGAMVGLGDYRPRYGRFDARVEAL